VPKGIQPGGEVAAARSLAFGEGCSRGEFAWRRGCWRGGSPAAQLPPRGVPPAAGCCRRRFRLRRGAAPEGSSPGGEVGGVGVRQRRGCCRREFRLRLVAAAGRSSARVLRGGFRLPAGLLPQGGPPAAELLTRGVPLAARLLSRRVPPEGGRCRGVCDELLRQGGPWRRACCRGGLRLRRGRGDSAAARFACAGVLAAGCWGGEVRGGGRRGGLRSGRGAAAAAEGGRV
jgi:hypothetical protein